ncbi:hypothetical protein APS56_07205 [Pseudalgibacter alginicilyticus]|uniref:Beta-carotene 15,15'-monooxygenase n=2 Tax=Pseudalgibacter alginicilyticus TaxID=1736674 RepID=A0A0P0CFJ6_9FLAO|nr:hypothetical protein APS56_07205 [Pseudalgibacter alginicilyticus]
MDIMTTLLEKINNAKALDFGDILSRTFELFKKTWLQGFLLMLCIFVVAIPIFVVIYMPMYTALTEQMQNGNYDPNEVSNLMMQTDSFRYQILGLTFVLSFLSTTLIAGFYRIIKKIDFNEPFSGMDLFYYFKGQYSGKILTIAALSFLVSLINFAFEKFLGPETASILGGVIAIIFSVYSTLFVVLFAFNPELESTEIFSLGFNLGTRKWMIVFGLMIITGIIGFFGIILCGVGMLFTFSIIYLPPYFIYKDVIGFNEKSEIEQIGEVE